MAISKGERSGTAAATINAQLLGRDARATTASTLRPGSHTGPKRAELVVRSAPGVYRVGRTPGRLHNFRLNPPTFASRGLQRQAARRSARGLAVR